MNDTINPEKRSIPSLDGLRAVSILMVIFSHLLLSSPNTLSTWVKFLMFGGVGVQFFFLISGFLITYLLMKELALTSTVSMVRFYIRRALRIIPPYYIFLGVLLIINQPLMLNISPSLFLSAALFIQNFAFWGHNWFIEHSWTLSVEEQFYLLWPFVFLSFRIFSIRLIFPISIVVGIAIRSISYKFPEASVYFLGPFLRHADSLFTGCFIAYLYHDHRPELMRLFLRVKPVYIVCALLTVVFFTRLEFLPEYDRIYVPLAGVVVNLGFGFAMLYFVLREKGFGYTMLNWPVVTFIGKISYSLYLWQQLFLSYTDYWWSQFPQNVLLTFAAALLSYYLVETPVQKLRSYFRTVKT